MLWVDKLAKSHMVLFQVFEPQSHRGWQMYLWKHIRTNVCFLQYMFKRTIADQ